MDSLGEVGKKMRSAIKAKLVELGNASSTGYIDDELPDYVMIMVANKRTKQQMLSELNLFLGSNTETFVNWLHQVLQKLQEVTLPSNLTTKAKKKIGESSSKKDKKKDKKKQQKEPSITDVIAVELMEKAKKTIDPKIKCEKSERSSKTPTPPPVSSQIDSPEKAAAVVNVSTQKQKDSTLVLHKKELAHLNDLERMIAERKNQPDQNDSEKNELSDQDEEMPESSPKNNTNNVNASVKSRLGKKEQVENSKPSNIISLSAIRKSETEFLKKIVVKQKEDNDRKLVDDYRSVRNRSGRTEITNRNRRERRSRSTSRERHHRNRDRVRRPRSRSRSPIKLLENRSRPSIRQRIGERMPSSPSSNKHSKTPETDGNFRIKQRPALSSTITAHAGKSLLLRAMADAQRSTQRASSESKKKQRDNIVVQVKNEKRNRHQNDEEYVPESISGHSESEAEYHPSYKSQEAMDDDGDVIYLNNNEDVDLMDDLDDNNEMTEKSPNFTIKLPNKEKSKSHSPTPPLYIKRKTPVKDRIGPRSTDKKDKDERPRKRSIQEDDMEVEECESQRAYNLVKKTRVSPIKFDLTDDEENAKSRSSSRDRSEKKKMSNKNVSNGEAKRIKLEASRSFDHVPALLSSVAVPVPESLKPPVIKSTEQCKFYPNCSNKNCMFLHPPTTQCKSFPNCKFGDACVYSHPKCKFDLSCKRIDCNYYHSPGIPASTPIIASSIVPVQNYKSITSAPNTTLCKFFPSCTNSNCNWYHPKICKFGRSCSNKYECNFYHFETASKNKFKWISPSS